MKLLLPTQNACIHIVELTIDGERCARLNVHVFNPIEVFAEILLHCLSHRYLLFSIINERHIFLGNFSGILENHEKHNCSAQQKFTCLEYPILYVLSACKFIKSL